MNWDKLKSATAYAELYVAKSMVAGWHFIVTFWLCRSLSLVVVCCHGDRSITQAGRYGVTSGTEAWRDE